MSSLRVVPIVEGHGEDGAIRLLLQRIWTELLGGEYVEVVKPIRGKRLKLIQASELARLLDLAVTKLDPGSDISTMVLVLLDADADPPCILGPQILGFAREVRADMDVSCVIANVEYETWFAAAAESLTEYLDLSRDRVISDRPEQARLGKAWIKKRFHGIKYSPSVDQPRLTHSMDLALCRSRSPSFDKLCRELEARLRLSA